MMSTMTSVADLRANEEARTLVAAPVRQTDTVIVKMRTTPPLMRMLRAAGGDAGERLLSRSVLASLIEQGHVREIVPIFPSAGAFAGPHSAVRSLTAAIDVAVPVKRARGLVSLKVESGTNAEQLAAHLSELGNEIEYAYVPPVKYAFLPRRKTKVSAASRRRSRPRAASNDPLASRQWGHGAVKLRSARARAGFVDADGVIVAVLDSGIDRNHPDLIDSIDSYTNFLSATEDDRDYKGHGTHVAGIISAGINNQIGVAGICAARVMALKALPKAGQSWNAEAYYQALAFSIGKNVKVLNMSLEARWILASAISSRMCSTRESPWLQQWGTSTRKGTRPNIPRPTTV